MRRSMMGRKKLQLFTKRFYPAGNYTWIVPKGCREVDVFLVGGGGAGHNGSGGGGGYTKTFKKDTSGWRDGDAISVAPGQSIPITVGKGGIGGYSEVAPNGGYSQFLNSSYRANGGNGAGNGYPGGSNAGAYTGGNGGSGGAGDDSDTAKADLTESAAAMKMALSIQMVPYMAEERVKGIQPAILANLLGNEMPEVVVQTEI